MLTVQFLSLYFNCLAEHDIRMLNAYHMTSICVACVIAIWTAVFVWQDDCNTNQCNSLLWLLYMPISYALQLFNAKVKTIQFCIIFLLNILYLNSLSLLLFVYQRHIVSMFTYIHRMRIN